VAISENTKNDIIDFYHIPPEKIRVIYQSCDSGFLIKKTQEEQDAVLKKYNLPQKFLLYVGSVIERKNLLNIIMAMERLPDNADIPLVVIGSGKAYFRKIKKYIADKPIRNRIIFTQNIEFSDLPCIYRRAQIFIYPSIYEGFGIPVIEALNSETPVITSPFSSLPEAGGESSFYVNPADLDAFAVGIEKILTDDELRKKMTGDGKKYAQNFAPEKVTREMMDLYIELLAAK
jgi:glycosyltransferase involved in cell wall biosynthesis